MSSACTASTPCAAVAGAFHDARAPRHSDRRLMPRRRFAIDSPTCRRQSTRRRNPRCVRCATAFASWLGCSGDVTSGGRILPRGEVHRPLVAGRRGRNDFGRGDSGASRTPSGRSRSRDPGSQVEVQSIGRDRADDRRADPWPRSPARRDRTRIGSNDSRPRPSGSCRNRGPPTPPSVCSRIPSSSSQCN